jgi:hypothetical protein
MYQLKSRDMSAVRMYLGTQVFFFQTCILFVLFSHGAVCCFVTVISPTTVPTLILQFFFRNDHMRTHISTDHLPSHHQEASLSLPFNPSEV